MKGCVLCVIVALFAAPGLVAAGFTVVVVGPLVVAAAVVRVVRVLVFGCE